MRRRWGTGTGEQTATQAAVETRLWGLGVGGHVRLQSGRRTQGLCAKHWGRCHGSQRDKSGQLQEYFLPCLERRLFIFQTMKAKGSIPLPGKIFPNPKFRICGPVIAILRGLQQGNVKMSIAQKNPRYLVASSIFKEGHKREKRLNVEKFSTSLIISLLCFLSLSFQVRLSLILRL